MTERTWPPLPLDAWRDTRDTLQMWTQIAGKICLALHAARQSLLEYRVSDHAARTDDAARCPTAAGSSP